MVARENNGLGATCDRKIGANAMTYLSSLGENATLSDILGAYPETSAAMLQYCEAALRGSSPFSIAERELIAAFVSGLNQCMHCYGVHSSTAEAFGIESGLLEDLLDEVGSAAVDDRMKPVLLYARKLTLTPTRLTRADADAVFAAGWNEKALHDAVAVCALYNFFNRFVTGLGLEIEASAAAERGKMLAEIGYAGLAERLGLVK
jgi:uncharacterized peroxidase-related enzyme